MQATPNPQDRHALRWILVLGLVFVAVVGGTLQLARVRADDEWDRLSAHWEENWAPNDIPSLRYLGLLDSLEVLPGDRGGQVIREWREGCVLTPCFELIVRQERDFFGSTLRADMVLDSFHCPSALVDSVRDIFAGVDVELNVIQGGSAFDPW